MALIAITIAQINGIVCLSVWLTLLILAIRIGRKQGGTNWY